MTSPLAITPSPGTADRWTFLRDVLVFQLKMFLDNVRDFALMPVSLVAALIDLVSRVSGKVRFSTAFSNGAHTVRK